MCGAEHHPTLHSSQFVCAGSVSHLACCSPLAEILRRTSRKLTDDLGRRRGGISNSQNLAAVAKYFQAHHILVTMSELGVLVELMREVGICMHIRSSTWDTCLTGVYRPPQRISTGRGTSQKWLKDDLEGEWGWVVGCFSANAVEASNSIITTFLQSKPFDWPGKGKLIWHVRWRAKDPINYA